MRIFDSAGFAELHGAEGVHCIDEESTRGGREHQAILIREFKRNRHGEQSRLSRR